MPPEVSPDNTNAASPAAPAAAARPAWWVRLLSRLPLGLLNAFAAGVGWLAFRVVRVPRSAGAQWAGAAPSRSSTRAQLRAVMRSYYLGFAQMLVELISAPPCPRTKSAGGCASSISRRRRRCSRTGQPVLLVAAHQCNWEWMLLGLSLELGYPLEAAYKPLVDRLGGARDAQGPQPLRCALVPATGAARRHPARRRQPRAIAMVADQEPRTSERRHWTRFMNRDTAFFMGPRRSPG